MPVNHTRPDLPVPRPTAADRDAALSLFHKASNFIVAASCHAAAGAPQCSKEEIDRRFAICQTNECGFFDGSACAKCGCKVSRVKRFLSKLAWADQSCPDTPPRWGPILPGNPG